MKVFMYSIYDRKAEVFQPPFCQPTDGAALRAVTAGVQKGNDQLSQFPGDFALYCVGQFHQDSGEVVLDGGKKFPVFVCSCDSLT